MDRIILHCDCNSFFASCEELLNPKLKEYPMAVTGDPEMRHGIILAKNQKAKLYSVQTAEPIWEAKIKCPDLICVLPHNDFYKEICNKINSIYLEYTDLVEKASIDESYLDITNSLHLFCDDVKEFADTLRNRIKSEVGITISIGVSFCKTVAKFGSDYKKPDATTVIMRENLPEIFWKQDVNELFLVGKKTVEKLKKMGIDTIGDLAHFDKTQLVNIFGKQGILLYETANGIDNSPVESFYGVKEIKSVGNSMTFKRDLVGFNEIKSGISFLADSVACRLRRKHLKCTVVQIGIKDSDFRTMQRQTTLQSPTNLQKTISDTATELLKGNWSMTQPVRLIAITASGLCDENEQNYQLNFFDNSTETDGKQEKIENMLDDIRNKFGNSAIKFGYFSDDNIGIK